jgi:hypothetical protein
LARVLCVHVVIFFGVVRGGVAANVRLAVGTFSMVESGWA